jgi:Protein of unknown function (DUF3352)
MPRILLTLAALATAIAFAAGCGSDGASSTSDAAELVPSGALVYAEATLEPEGDQKAAIDALISKFPGEGSAGDRIRRLMEKAFAEGDTNLDYEKDIEPWLGDQAAFYLTSFSPDGEDPDGAFLVATEDEDATVDAIEKDGDVRKSEYRGLDLYESDDETTSAVRDGWLLLGSPAGVKKAIDVAEGGDPITEDEAYERALDDAADDRLGFLYFNSPAFFQELRQSPGGATLPDQFRRFFEEPVVATAHAGENAIRLESTVPASLLTGFPIVAEGSDLAAELPSDAWLAMAQPDLGKTIDSYIELVAGTVGGRDVIAEQLEAATGLDLEEDVVSWMGDWAVFVRGTTVAELNGALMIETSDEAASGRVIDAIARLVREDADSGVAVRPLELSGGEGVTISGPELDQPLHFFQRDGKVVLAYGDAAARDALDPAETLGDSASFAKAKEALGGDYAVSFYLAMEPILRLVESTPAASDQDWQTVKPYLEPLGALVGGARKDGDDLRSAFGVTVK